MDGEERETRSPEVCLTAGSVRPARRRTSTLYAWGPGGQGGRAVWAVRAGASVGTT